MGKIKKKSDFCKSIPSSYFNILQENGILLNYTKGREVFREGNLYNGFYIVESGLFKIYKLNESGKENIIKLFYPGESIATLPLFNKMHTTYPASCQNVFDGNLLFFDVQKAEKMLIEHIELKNFLMEEMTDFTKYLLDRINSQFNDNAEAKLIKFLCNIGANDKEQTIDIPKNQIALLLSITPETFSRTVNQMKKKGKLFQEKDRYRLLDNN